MRGTIDEKSGRKNRFFSVGRPDEQRQRIDVQKVAIFDWPTERGF